MAYIVIHGYQNPLDVPGQPSFGFQVTLGHEGHESFGFSVAEYRARKMGEHYLLEETEEIDPRNGTALNHDTRHYKPIDIMWTSEKSDAQASLHQRAVSRANRLQTMIGDKILDLTGKMQKTR